MNKQRELVVFSAFLLDKKEPERCSGAFWLRETTVTRCCLSRKKVPERRSGAIRLKKARVVLFLVKRSIIFDSCLF